jgi:hypothetical protein
MWTVVYLAPNKEAADRIAKILSQEGLLTKVRESKSIIEGGSGYIEVLVPEMEVDEAHDILLEIIGG